MKKYQEIAAAIFIGFLAAICTSCPEIMSTSWGKWAKRPPDIPAITDGNLDDLLDATMGDPDFAKALLEELNEQSRNADTEKKAQFQGAAITAAANGSGLDTLVLVNIGDLMKAMDNENIDKITEIFENIFNDADYGTIHALTGNLTEILLSADTYDSSSYWENPSVTTDSLFVATVLLIAAEADDRGESFENYLDDFQQRRESSASLSENEEAILILTRQLEKQDNATFGPLLEGLKLDNIQ
jgi:hypothetical protein